MPISLTGSITQGTQSVSGNYSPVTVVLHIVCTGTAHAYDSPPGSITINGSTYNFTHNFGQGANEDIASYTVNVPHNSDGTKTVECSGYFEGYNKGEGSYWYWSGSKVLDTIPRVSSISADSSSVTAGGTQTITTTKKSSSFTDSIKVSLGSKSMTVTSGTAFTIPIDWCTQITNSMSGTVTATVTTKSGSTVIGTNSTTFTLNVPSYDITIDNRNVVAVNADFLSKYVQGLARVSVDTSASGYQGSTISSYITTIEGKSYSGTSITSDYLTTSGSLNVKTVITDSRGKTKTETTAITVIPYHYPILEVSAIALSSTSTCTVTLKGSISPVNDGTSDLNAKTYTITWVDNAGNSGTLANAVAFSDYTFDGTSGHPVVEVTHSNIDPTYTYTYTVKATDTVGYTQVVSVTGVVCFSRHAGGDGVTFGAEASEDGFHVASDWDATVYNNATGNLDVKRLRNIFISTSSPRSSNGENGDVWLKYEV